MAAEAVQLTDEERDAALMEKRKRLFRLFAVGLVAVALVVGLWYLLLRAGRVETDNAYVGADVAQVTALVSGPVADVRVSGTQMVRKGDVLVVIDPADTQIELAAAEAALRQARQHYAQSKAQVVAASARTDARGADIGQAEARLREAEATFDRARLDLQRRERLAPSGAVAGEELSNARAVFAATKAARDLAAAALDSARSTRGAATGDQIAAEAGVRGTDAESFPEVASARARVDRARLDLERTVIRAPVAGVVTNRQVQVGQRIAAGATIMSIVPVDAVYVDANFKESQLRHVRIGQPVELESDFYGSDVVYHGRVIGFSGGTGAAFALIPAQNATGNWVKVVQRLPVRIMLDPKQLRDHPLRVGLSMTATIDTRGD